MSFITGWIEDKVSGYAKTGIQAGGTMAGNAVGGVGSLVENAGKSVANGVTGSIGGVGAYINSYGTGIMRSMSADGPVSASSAQKKTAVKPGAPAAAQKAPTSGAAAKPSTQGRPGTAPRAAPKALPAPRGGAGTPKPAAQVSRGAAGAGQRPVGARPVVGAGGAAKPPADGKTRISAASRPKASSGLANRAGAGTASRPGNKAVGARPPSSKTAGDPLAIGGMFDKKK